MAIRPEAFPFLEDQEWIDEQLCVRVDDRVKPVVCVSTLDLELLTRVHRPSPRLQLHPFDLGLSDLALRADVEPAGARVSMPRPQSRRLRRLPPFHWWMVIPAASDRRVRYGGGESRGPAVFRNSPLTGLRRFC